MTWVARLALAALAAVFAAPRLEPGGPSPFGTDEAPGMAPLTERLGVGWLRAPGPRMILIPSSTFRMGSTGEDVVDALVTCQREQRGTECDPSLFSNEGPVRTVALSAYFLDRTEVTVLDYARCVALGKCRAAPFQAGARRFEGQTLPVTLVTWDDAHDYCAFRGARLPTEAEFERAARGPSGRRYPWGDLYSSHAANHGRFAWSPTDAIDGFRELAPVSSFPEGRTKEGVEDLAGNASEWVSDRYLPEYDPTDLLDPKGPEVSGSSPARVVRGGSYESAAPWLRGAARGALDPGVRKPTVGFRCARGRRAGREE